MKFSEFPYKRPDFESFQKEMRSNLETFKNAKSAQEQIECLDKINVLRNMVSTQGTLSSIRHSINNNDEFYNAENDYWDEYGPLYQNEESELAKTILASSFIDELKAHYPTQFFTLLECSVKSFDECLIEDMQEENKLVSRYNRIKATAQIEFEGKTYTLPELGPLALSNDRDLRRRANEAAIGYYEKYEAEIDEIYDSLVKVRDRMAKKLGFKNYIELGYLKMCRSDYNADMVANYRKQILEFVTPAVAKLLEEQRERLGYETLHYYDESYEFESGMPKPQGSPEWILENGTKMYHELSKETSEFFDFMMGNELMDLLSKPGKEGGGYCTFMPDFQAPFIFSNFNGTSGDIDVLTHEAGHAFQIFSSRSIAIPDLQWPTMESCEIHSMSMEFFTYPWMKLFFKDDVDKYYYHHLTGTLRFLPYGVLVDHFQHEVYEHPEYTPAQRKETWRRLEKMYLPFKNYEGADFYERGNWWFKQGHIFASPFYYIDYTLAQVCALQFFAKLNDNYEEAWKDYLHLCKQGGTKSFLGLVKEANLDNPFVDGCISKTMEKIQPKIDEFSKGNIK